MSRVKDIRLKVIPPKIANRFITKWHYSGKVVQNSQLHFGAFLYDSLHGVISYGPPLDKKKVLPLVHKGGKPCKWNEMLEINRMAFDGSLPPNSESRCIAVSIKLIKKNAPHIKWLLSFADATQCGDGAIYRASGFYLTGINANKSLLKFPSGDIIAAMTLEGHFNLPIIKKQCDFLGIEHKYRTRNEWIKLGAARLNGYQLRYIYLIDKECKLNCPNIPYGKIDEIGAGMYKGEKISIKERQNASVA